MYCVKHFYHILTDGLTKGIYKNNFVITAEVMAKKSMLSTQFSSILNIDFHHKGALLYVTEKLHLENWKNALDTLYNLWNESADEIHAYIELYKQNNIKKLNEYISCDERVFINKLFV